MADSAKTALFASGHTQQQQQRNTQRLCVTKHTTRASSSSTKKKVHHSQPFNQSTMEGMPGPSKPSPPEEEKKPPMIKLKSSDGVIIKVNFKVARLSVTLRTMLDNLGIAEGDAKDAKDDDEDPIPLANVDAATLRKVIQWATHHQDTDPLTLENSDNGNVLIPPWDDAFLGELDQKMLLGIIEAANYLDIKGLQNFSVQKVVDMIRGKTVEQLRELFKLN